MPLSIQCPACQAKLNAPDNLRGKRVKCPKCQATVTVPAASAAPAVSQARPAPVPLTPIIVSQAPASAESAAPEARRPGTALPWLLAGAIGAGGLLLVGVVAAVVIVLNWPSGRSPADRAVAAATPKANSPPAPPAPPVVAAPATATPAASQVATGQVEWALYENAEKGFKAVFPGRQPDSIDPLSAIEDPEQRKLAEAMTKEMTVLGATHGGRKFTLTCAPLVLGGVAPGVYLDRMSAGLRILHQGFSIEPVSAADKSAPVRDYVLTKSDAGKLLRVVVGQGQVFHLLIEGESGLAFSDPAAQQFFGKFQCAGVSAAAVTTSASGESQGSTKRKKSAAAPPDAPDGLDWRPFQGNKVAFTINFPGVTPQAEDPLSLILESNRQNQNDNWARDGVVVESFAAQVGERRYGVTAFRDPNRRQEGSIRFAGQMQGLLRTFAQDIHQEVRDHVVRSRRPPSKLEILATSSLAMRDGSKAIVRQCCLGHYGFVVRVEGPAAMEDLDPQVHKFLDSLQPPPDAAPLPLNVRPLPGPKPEQSKQK